MNVLNDVARTSGIKTRNKPKSLSLQLYNEMAEVKRKLDSSRSATAEVNDVRGKTEILRDESGEIRAINVPDGEEFVKVHGKWFDLKSDPNMTRPREMEIEVGEDGTVTIKGKIGNLGFVDTNRPDGSRVQETQMAGRSTTFEFGKDGKIQRIVSVCAEGNETEEFKF